MSDDTTLRIERLIDAPPDAVFRVWTTREAMESWYRDGDDFVARVAELDLRVGGGYRVEFGPRGQEPFVEHGVYLEIDPPRRLVMSETLDGVEAPWANTRVTIELRRRTARRTSCSYTRTSRASTIATSPAAAGRDSSTASSDWCRVRRDLRPPGRLTRSFRI